MNKLSKEKKDKLILIGIITCVVCIGFYYLVISNQKKALVEYDEKIGALESQISKAGTQIRRANITQNQLKQIRAKVSSAEEQMIPEEATTGNKWILDLVTEFIRNRYDLRPTGLSNSPLIGTNFLALPRLEYSGALYELDLQGYYHEFGKFLADFENSFPFMNVQYINMWPLATPSATGGAKAVDPPQDVLEGPGREKLSIKMKIGVLVNPSGNL